MKGEALGLKLNVFKCRIINDHVTPAENIFQGLIHLKE
jgi:hypothetical protein